MCDFVEVFAFFGGKIGKLDPPSRCYGAAMGHGRTRTVKGTKGTQGTQETQETQKPTPSLGRPTALVAPLHAARTAQRAVPTIEIIFGGDRYVVIE